jgi:Na+-translocating ferredoxin:NAD+ oxidoreductase subunit D
MITEKENKYLKLSSPFIRTKRSKQKIMFMVIIALIPAFISSIYFFKLKGFIIISACLITSILTDILMQRLTRKKSSDKINYFNGSAILTGLLLSFVLPPTVPLFIPVLGSIFAIALGKYAFGVGNNIFNPALIARAFLVISFPQLMTTWVNPDGVTSATPLASGTGSLFDLFIGNVGGCIGETSALMLLIGGVFLIFIRVIDWRIPFYYLGTFAILTYIIGQDVVFQLLAGGLMLGAFFMATDYVTMPVTRNGRIIFAVMLGLLTFLFRFYSNMPEGVMYSILIMNAVAPLIQRITKPKPFGYFMKEKKKNEI